MYQLLKDFSKQSMPSFCMKLSLIFLWRNFSGVSFAYLKMFNMSSLCLHASPEELAYTSDPGFDAWSFTFGHHWSWSKNHRCPVSRCSAGTTSSTCYKKSGPRKLFIFQSIGQCASPQRRSAKKRHKTSFHPHLCPPDSPDLNPVDNIKCGAWWKSKSTIHQSMM